MRLTLFGKADCPLCDEAKAVLAKARRRVPFELELVDIEVDRTFYEAYKWEIPVVHVNGKLAFKHHLDLEKVVTRLERESL